MIGIDILGSVKDRDLNVKNEIKDLIILKEAFI